MNDDLMGLLGAGALIWLWGLVSGALLMYLFIK